MQTYVTLIRHGQTDWNAVKRWQGHTETYLDATGRAQAAEIAEALRAVQPKPTRIISSPLQRAYATGEIIAAALGVPLSADDRLREVDVGAYAGLTSAEVAATYGDKHRKLGGFAFAGGEDFAQLDERVEQGLEAIAVDYAGQHVLVTAHGGVIWSVIRRVLKLYVTVDIKNCSTTHLIHNARAEDGRVWRSQGIALTAERLLHLHRA